MTSHNAQVQAIIRRILAEKSINLITNADIVKVQGRTDENGESIFELICSDSRHFLFDEAISCTSASAQAWLRESGLSTTSEGFVCVQSTLESVNVKDVFACGDVCHLVDNPRPKAGVFAVRAGPPLLLNLRHRLLGEPLEPWLPQDQFLGIISTGDGYAVSSKGPIAIEGDHQWDLKDSIDREWMRGYQDLKKADMVMSTETQVNISIS
jgi:selenide,water dikinase